MLKTFAYLSIPIGLLTATGIQPASAATITQIIDDFITVQEVLVDASAPASDGDSAPASSAIGGERDLFVEKTTGTAGERIRTGVNPNSQDLLRQVIDEARGRTIVTWDGADGLPGAGDVDYGGLGSIDFSIYDALEIIVSFSDSRWSSAFHLLG